MSQERKEKVNKLLAGLYARAQIKNGYASNYDTANELVGAIEMAIAFGATINGYDINGNLVSCPSI